jgi:hypothetical protein
LAGSIQLNQPGGVGVVAGGIISPNARVYPTFIGATTTTWNWSLVSSVSGAAMQQSARPDPYFDVIGNGPYTIAFIDSNGVLYLTGCVACEPGDFSNIPPFADE